MSTWGRSTRTALRMRVNMSAMGSVIMIIGSLYQLAFFTPGISPSSASLRKQIRQMPNLRYTARGRPHSRQRLFRAGGELRRAQSPWRSSIYLPCSPVPSVRSELPALASACSVRNGIPKPRSSSRASSSLSVRGDDRDVHPLRRGCTCPDSTPGRPTARSGPGCSCRARRTRPDSARGSRAPAASASEISRSRNSYIRRPRSVTLQPIAIPSRSWKPAIDLRAMVTTGFWPAIMRQRVDRFFQVLLLADRARPRPC